MTKRAIRCVMPNIESIIISPKRRFPTNPLFAILFIAVSACAQPSPAPQADGLRAVTPRAVTGWLNQERRTIGVIALGPDQMMGHHWFEFDPGVRRWLAKAPTMTTRKRRPPPKFKDAFADQSEAFMLNLAQQAVYDPRILIVELAMAPLVITLQTMVASLTLGQEYESSRPLADIRGVDKALTDTLDKKRIAEAIGEQFILIATDETNHDVRNLAFEDIADTWSIEGVDKALTVRVVDIGLWAGPTLRSELALSITVWTHFDRNTFLPFDYKSEGRPLEDWTRNDGRFLRQEIDKAARGLAQQIAASLFIARQD